MIQQPLEEALVGGEEPQLEEREEEVVAAPPPVFTYNDLFPPLPMGPTTPHPATASNNTDNMRVGSSSVTQVSITLFYI